MTEYALDQWQGAVRSFRVAQAAFGLDWDSTASRAYYAAFHAVTALFALKDKSFTKHSALRSAIHRDLVHEGIWPEEYGGMFDELMDLRESGDYGVKPEGVTLEGAQKSLFLAHVILTAVSVAEPKLFPASDIPPLK